MWARHMLTVCSIPFSAATIVVLSIAWPTREDKGGPASVRYSWSSAKKIDFLGSATLLCACCLLIVGLQQAGAAHLLWSDAVIIAVLALSALSSIVFIVWQIILNKGAFGNIKPIFPVKLLRNRVFSATLVYVLDPALHPADLQFSFCWNFMWTNREITPVLHS